jgi:hypothetical protein
MDSLSARFLFGLLWALLLSPLLLAGAQEAPAPYLYTYDNDLGSFVIERADGSDRRVLSAAATQQGMNDIQVWGWSPSGRWLAWTSGFMVPGSCCIRSTDAWAVDVTGTKTLDMLANLGEIYDMVWSPTEDLLFVSDYELGDSTDFSLSEATTHRFFLIDAQTQSTLTTFELDIAFENLERVSWTLGGQYVMFAYTAGTEDEPQSFLRRIERTGAVEDIPIAQPLSPYVQTQPYPPINEWVLTQSEDGGQLIAVDPISLEMIAFDAPATIGRVFLYEWNYTGDHALIYLRTPRSGDSYELWLLSLADHTLRSLATDAGIHVGQDTLWVSWAPDTNHAVFYTDEALYGVDITPALRVFQILVAPDVGYGAHTSWYGSAQFYFSARLADAATTARYKHYIYDFSQHTLTEQAEGFTPPDHPSRSGRYSLTAEPLTLIDHSEERSIPITPDSRAAQFPYYELWYASWDENETWFITAETNTPGDDRYFLNMSVNSIDGKVHRELGSGYSASTAWLPERVAAHL